MTLRVVRVSFLANSFFIIELARTCESLDVFMPSLNSVSQETLSVSFFLRELVHALMRQSQETSSIARAHL
jgi:hypothetical protein